MVDLVKIRKKAMQRAAAGSGAGGQASPELAIEAKGSGVADQESGEPAGEGHKTAEAAREKRSASKRSSAASPERQTGAQADSNVEAVAAAPTTESVPGTQTDSRLPTPGPPIKSTKLDRFKAQAGKRREEADSVGRAATEALATEARLEVLTFAIAGEHYAIDIEHIVEIVPSRAATHVPNAADAIVGIMSLRGTIVTLIDVRYRLKHAAVEPTGETRIIVIEREGETVGFEVDRVFRVVKISASDVAPHPVVHASELDDSIRGVFRHGDSLTILLDFAKLLGGKEIQRTGRREAFAAGR